MNIEEAKAKIAESQKTAAKDTAARWESLPRFSGWCACEVVPGVVRVKGDTYPATCLKCYHRIDPRK